MCTVYVMWPLYCFWLLWLSESNDFEPEDERMIAMKQKKADQ